MTKTYKLFFTGLFSVGFAQAGFAQTELATIQGKLASYTKTQAPEKLFVHTDKNFYTAGEIVWFKIYVVDGILHQPLPASKVAYFEILGKNNVPVSRAKLGLTEKGGNGSVQLPFNLESGNYKLRAYTNWMKNTGAESFFEKAIAVVNPLKSPDNQAGNVAANTLQLFPEGGNLVAGLPSKIAFHLTDKSGKGLPGKGYLVNARNDTLASFAAYKFGMGHFNLTPQKNETYRAVFTLPDGSTIAQPLPTVYETGYTLQADEPETGKIRIIVKSNVRTGYPEIYLLAQTRQQVKAVQKNIVAEGTAAFVLDKKSLGEGISQVTIFDNEKRPVCERLLFVQPTSQKQLSLTSSKETYGTRERVDLSFHAPLNGSENMSLSVYQLDELQAETPNIAQYLWLSSELGGTIEQPGYYLSGNGEEVRQATDYLMLTHGWRRFKWEAALQPSAIKFPRERTGHVITGKVTDVRTNEPAKDIQMYLSAPGSAEKLFTGISDANGLVHFEVRDYFGQGELIIQTNTQRDSFYKVDVLSPFAETFYGGSYSPLMFMPSQKNLLTNHSISMQAQHLYNPDSIQKFSTPVAAYPPYPFYGTALVRYNLDEYVRFNTMEEVLREYVREINVGVKGSGSSLRFKLFNATSRDFYTDDILVMVDGIPLFNANQAFTLNPLKIKQLEIVNQNYILGASRFYGLANFSSYDGKYEGLELHPAAVSIDYEGLQLQREFYTPDYASESNRKSRIPDLRTTLFWAPNVEAGPTSFYTADNKGTYLIVLQGIDGNGHTIHSATQINVQ